MFDVATATFFDNYQAVLQAAIIQQLEDTVWMTEPTRTRLLSAGFRAYDHVRSTSGFISLRKAGLQRLVLKSLAARDNATTDIQIPLLIRFMLSAVDIPRAPKIPNYSVAPGQSLPPLAPSSNETQVSETELHDQVSDLPGGSVTFSGVPPASVAGTPSDAPTTFRGNIVDTSKVSGNGPPTGSGGARRDGGGSARRDRDFSTPTGNSDPPLQDDDDDEDPSQSNVRPRASLSRTPTRLHPFSAEVTFGAETFEDYMTQCVSTEVKHKDFRKANFVKFDFQSRRFVCSLVQTFLLHLPSVGHLVPTLRVRAGGYDSRRLVANASRRRPPPKDFHVGTYLRYPRFGRDFSVWLP